MIIHPIFIGDTMQKRSERGVKGEYVVMLGEIFYKIQNYKGKLQYFQVETAC